MENQADVIILGAGPAGLSSAFELLRKGKSVIVLERDRQVGGISKTIEFQGCFFDLGGHRFHTDLTEVMDLWEEILGDDLLTRPRLSRIYYKNKFFNYPLKPLNAFFGLGVFESLSVVSSYLVSKAFPFKEEKTFEQWVSNRFGKRLFRIFFKTYTEKVWGIPCSELRSEWSSQRIKGLNLFEAIKNSFFAGKKNKTKTLIDKFRYPKYGPGMMYEKMADEIKKMGGKIILNTEFEKMEREGDNVKRVTGVDEKGKRTSYAAKDFISTIPINTLVKNIFPQAPGEISRASGDLKYRSFIAVSVILECPNPFPDNWIYIHSPEVKLGRIQNFKNWSPFMVDEKNKTTLGLEYFCDQNDEFWKKDDEDMIDFAMEEAEKTNLAKKGDFVGGFVSRIPKAYPIYNGDYQKNIGIIREYLRGFENLQTIGRGGMFRYNNMDHSVLSGLWAAGNILGEKNDIWEIND